MPEQQVVGIKRNKLRLPTQVNRITSTSSTAEEKKKETKQELLKRRSSAVLMRMKAVMLAVCFLISVVVLAECSPVPEYLIIREVHNLPLTLYQYCKIFSF